MQNGFELSIDSTRIAFDSELMYPVLQLGVLLGIAMPPHHTTQTEVFMELGKKILQLRTERGLTQKQLGYMAGLSEPAIRNYELGNRTPDQKQIQKIAKALEVNPEAISEQKEFTNKEAEQVLFLLEDEFDVIPVSGDTGVRIEPKPGSYLYNVVKKWASYRKQLDAGEITEDEYRALKDSFSAGKCI